MSQAPVALILGAGPNIGASLAAKFARNGYKIALVSRSLKPGTSAEGYLNIVGDFANTDVNHVPSIFKEVQEKIGTPSVVIYNAYQRVVRPGDDPLSATLAEIKSDVVATFDSAYLSAQEAVKGFRTLPAEVKKTFIYTGNALNQNNFTIPAVTAFAVGKSSASALIQALAKAYEKESFNFYYTDERKEGGAIAGTDVSGEAAAGFYAELANTREQGPWLATFVKDKGYVAF